MGPHGEEVEGSLDEGEWGDVGRQLDVEMDAHKLSHTTRLSSLTL